jgi:hypothetical protein
MIEKGWWDMLMINLKVFFVNYVLVVEEGHMGGMLGVDKQVIRSHSTFTATNTHANQVPPFQGMHYVIIV